MDKNTFTNYKLVYICDFELCVLKCYFSFHLWLLKFEFLHLNIYVLDFIFYKFYYP